MIDWGVERERCFIAKIEGEEKQVDVDKAIILKLQK